jgi:hypothetical protein
VYCRLCLQGAPPDGAQEGAPQQPPSETQTPQAVVAIEISMEEFQEIRRQMDRAASRKTS